jgi:hypothetical protein
MIHPGKNPTSNLNNCCLYCGKPYKLKTNLERHMAICELVHTKKPTDEEEYTPSLDKLFKMVLELGKKYNELDQKVEKINKLVIKERKKVNVIEWLNSHLKPFKVFNEFIQSVEIIDNDVLNLLDNPVIDTLNDIMSREIFDKANERILPIITFAEKPNVFYIYQTEEELWCELSREVLSKMVNLIHSKLSTAYWMWKKENRQLIKDSDHLENKCDRTLVKLMSLETKDATLLKIKQMMFSGLKTEIKALIEYEFEF